MLPVNEQLEDRIILDGDAHIVRGFVETIAPEVLRGPMRFGTAAGGFWGRGVSRSGTLVRLVETPEAFELRVLADERLADRITVLADAYFGSDAVAA